MCGHILTLGSTRHLYSLVGLEPSREVTAAVERMMESAKKSKKCPTCRPTPLNSTEVAQAWRQTLTWQQVRDISQQCAPVLRRLGYRDSFHSQAQLRDLSVSVVGPVTGV